MSGGTWNYRQWEIEECADEIRVLLRAVAKTEHILDWAEAGDTLPENAAKEVYDLWVNTFNQLYGY